MKDLILLGSTGSIGNAVLNVVKKNKSNFKIKLLTTNKNVKKIYKQAVYFNVKKVVILDSTNYDKLSHLFRKKNIKVYSNIDEALKTFTKKVYFAVSGISGIEGLEPTLKTIKYTKNLGIANKSR